jgi:hypothetical protein
MCAVIDLMRSRSLAVAMLIALVALADSACTRRYAAGLIPGAPRHDIDDSTALSASTQPPPAVKSDRKPAVATQKPSTGPARLRTAPRDQSAGTVGTTGIDAAVPEPPPVAGVVTVTTTPGTETQPAPTRTQAVAMMISRTLKRPAAAVPIGAGFASAVVSVALYRRRHRIPN